MTASPTRSMCRLFSALLALGVGGAPACVLAAWGDLDAAFGSGGQVYVAMSATSSDLAYSMAVDGAGNSYLTGETSLPMAPGDYDLSITKINASGQLVTGFGNNGRVVMDIGGVHANDFGSAIALGPDGHLYVAAAKVSGATSTIVILKFDSNGQPVTGFGSAGIAMILTAGSYAVPTALTFDASGNLVVAGYSNPLGNFDFTVVKLSMATGSVVAGFAVAGVRTIDLGGGGTDYATSMTIDASGNLYVGGYRQASGAADFGVVKLNSNGAPVAAFGAAGTAFVDFVGDDYAYSLILDKLGSLYVAGATIASGNSDFAVAKLSATTGMPVTTFGSAGKARIDIGTASSDGVAAITLDPSGRVLLAGASTSSGVRSMAAAAIDTRGQALASFGTAGKITYPVGGQGQAFGIAMDTNGRVRLAGYGRVITPASTTADFALLRLAPSPTIFTNAFDLD